MTSPRRMLLVVAHATRLLTAGTVVVGVLTAADDKRNPEQRPAANNATNTCMRDVISSDNN